MRFGWIAAFVPDARGVRWVFGLLLLPAVWLAKGGGTPAPGGPAVARSAAVSAAPPAAQWVARPALDSARTAR